MKRYFRGFLIATMFFVTVSYTGAFLSDSVAVSGNTFTAGTWTPGPVTITEVLYDPSSGSDTGLEWIEMKNTGQYPININNYLLHFATSGSNDFVFPNISLNPNQVIIVYVNKSGTNTSSVFYWENTGGNNMGDAKGSVSLFKNSTKDSSNMVDFVQYGEGGQNYESAAVAAGIWTAGDFVPGVTTGYSIQLISADNNLSTDWFGQSTPNPGV